MLKSDAKIERKCVVDKWMSVILSVTMCKPESTSILLQKVSPLKYKENASRLGT